jgi:hypothetical protein
LTADRRADDAPCPATDGITAVQIDDEIARSGTSTRHRTRPAAFAVLIILVTAVVWAFDRHYRFFDMAIYHGALRWWTAGGDLYGYRAPGGLGFTYPPFAALVLLPVAPLSVTAAGWLNVAGSLLALGVVLGVLTDPIAARHWSRRTLLALTLVLALATEPVRQTLGLGQVNLLLFALVVLDLEVLARHGSRWAGAGVGIATAVKLTPGLFIVYLLVTRRWRTAGTAIAVAGTLTASTVLLAPAESVRYFGRLLWQTERVGAASAVANQSLSGLLARLSDRLAAPGSWWLVLSALILLVGLRRAGRAHAAHDETAALALVGITANLICPISWTHHLVFLPVALLVLADTGRRGHILMAGVGYALCVLSPIWYGRDALPRPLHFVAENAFVLIMIVLVFRLPRRTARAGTEVPARAV